MRIKDPVNLFTGRIRSCLLKAWLGPTAKRRIFSALKQIMHCYGVSSRGLESGTLWTGGGKNGACGQAGGAEPDPLHALCPFSQGRLERRARRLPPTIFLSGEGGRGLCPVGLMRSRASKLFSQWTLQFRK